MQPIASAAVVGAGNMGSGIAQKMASKGVRVVLVDQSTEQAEKGKAGMAKTLHKGIARGVVSAAQVAETLALIEPTANLADVAQTDLVVEAIFENKLQKQELFTTLGELCAPTTILATNTSSFLVADMAKGTAHPERVVGLHFFFHPAMNRLVEVIGHRGTSPEILQRAWQAQEQTGKTPIASKDAPGFVVNRYFVPWLNESVRLLEEGVPVDAIETVAKQSFGVGMGPFELMNVTGVPIALHAAASLAEQLHAFYAPAARLAQQVDSKALWAFSPKAMTPAADETVQLVEERLWGTIFHVVGELLSEHVGTEEATDIGAKVGLRWPCGPVEKMQQVGHGTALGWARKVQQRYGLQMPAVWAEHN